MTTWKVRRVVVEVQEGFVEAATADDAAILGNHMGVYSPLDKHITVFDVVAEPPADPDLFSEVQDRAAMDLADQTRAADPEK